MADLPKHDEITSVRNETVKAARALEMRKARKETGQFLVEGAELLARALAENWTPVQVFFREAYDETPEGLALLAAAAAAGARLARVGDAVMDALTGMGNPPPLAAVLEQRWAAAPRPDAGGMAPWLLLDRLRDPGNLGTILRSADAAGAAGVLLVGEGCDPFSREAVRASTGSVFRMPVAAASEPEALALIAAWPGSVVGSDVHAGTDYREVRPEPPLLLLLGSESDGLAPDLAATARTKVRIPMRAGVESLNVATAAALLLYGLAPLPPGG